MAEGIVRANVERRSTARQCLADKSLAVMLTSSVQPRPAAVDNISPGGMAFRMEQPVDPGTVLPVELLNRTGQFWHLKVMCVVHATPCQDGGWLVGNMFLARLSDDEFRGLFGASEALAHPRP